MRSWAADKTRRLRWRLISVLSPQMGKLLDSRYRPAIGAVKEIYEGYPVVGCEIGVAAGENAEWILKTLNVKRLYLVDPYLPYDEPLWKLSDHVDCLEPCAHEQLDKYDQVVFLKVTSEKAVSLIKEPLDFVYIDGDHSYDCCLNDIVEYYSKVKKGGVVGGHNFQPEFPGVIRAVSQFCFLYGLKFKVCKNDWWIVKP